MTRILVVDDEPQLLRALQITLKGHGYDTVTAADGRHALAGAASAHPDLVLLDLGLPDIDGVDVIRQLRAWTPIPIIILSGRLASRAKVDALDAGADDYVTKPFNVEELLARLRAATRRATPRQKAEPVRLGRWIIDTADRRITDAAESGAAGEASEIHLSPTEWQVLDVLLAHPGALVTQRHLLQAVWGPTYVEETHYLRQYVKHLRRKLEQDPSRPRHLLTEPGLGYRFLP